MEKMKLFSGQIDVAGMQKRDTPVIRRKTRRQQSRFKTQVNINILIRFFFKLIFF